METKNKLLILSLSFAIFIVGVRALYSEPAVVQTVRAVKRNKKR